MKIIQVVPSLEAEASGPSYSVPRLAESLAALGHDVVLMSAGGQAVSPGAVVRFERFDRDLGAVPVAKLLQLSEGMRRALMREAVEADLIHANGMWTGPTLYPAWAAAAASKALVVSPRGTLSPVALRRSALRKKLFWRIFQRSAVGHAQVLHATSEGEYADIRRFGLRQPVAVIPNGVDLEPPVEVRRRDGPLRLLYLGRIHPIKGLEPMLHAWRAVADRFPQWVLRLVGPGPDDYRRQLEELVRAHDIPNVTFAPARYGGDKLREYAEADLFILPSFTENFGMTVAEALAQERPVITTTGTPWRDLARNGCGWWVEPTSEALARAMCEAMGLGRGPLAQMGRRGRAWMQAEFGWLRIAAEMAEVYAWTLGQGPRPTCVELA